MHYLQPLWDNLNALVVGFIGGMAFRQQALKFFHKLLGLL